MDGPACAHSRVVLGYHAHDDGTRSDVWTCGDCGSLFLPFALAELHTAQASAPIREELGRAQRTIAHALTMLDNNEPRANVAGFIRGAR